MAKLGPPVPWLVALLPDSNSVTWPALRPTGLIALPTPAGGCWGMSFPSRGCGPVSALRRHAGDQISEIRCDRLWRSVCAFSVSSRVHTMGIWPVRSRWIAAPWLQESYRSSPSRIPLSHSPQRNIYQRRPPDDHLSSVGNHRGARIHLPLSQP